MKNRHIAITLGIIVTSIALLFSACKKINDATQLGGDLIPPIDNINTFDTIMNVEAYNDTFTLATDSLRLASSEEHFLGLINADPIFGKTDARLFLELKPQFFARYPFARQDSVRMDSVVLVLNYLETYGDSSIAQTVNVYELDTANDFRANASYLIRANDFIYPPVLSPVVLGSKTFLPSELKDSVKAFQDTTLGQLRISLDTNFARRMFTYDTTNAYKSDSLFGTFLRGFAIQSMNTGNAVIGIQLQSVNTKLAFYYTQPKKSGSFDSTTVTYFPFTVGSASANYVKRDYAGTPVEAAAGGPLPDPIIYLQNSPGTFATIKIPGLSSLSNRVIHRAELVVEQIYDQSDTMFRVPEYLYVDAYDSSASFFRTIPYDLTLDGQGFINYQVFGAIPEHSVDGSGNPINIWRLNISRYVQHIVTKTQTSYDLRLSTPLALADRFGTPPTSADIPRTIFVNSSIVKGRIRLLGNLGSTDTNPHRLRLHIIYSKL